MDAYASCGGQMSPISDHREKPSLGTLARQKSSLDLRIRRSLDPPRVSRSSNRIV
eukprot:CAMPEP_0198684702 /NCGR_PEP_ID=MMETSP1468-20131203/12571_1 /TAXON_ID=1461545 /ORGANISM="Mantoniella sp, Strain CCMP1436" /LENGTH=54 /DNA_ID=CAMNT_0044429685 /DNA_START=59 /DNA_END=223 /DNA_ORIENTATION=-